ncbi:response regulator [Catenovulum sp. SM1970]|uniref:ATP-binding hybrid sensor histidine kinase/response regulator n=1 Tax=Marinifaba aquimaris TaxID=2741323 RepID=UPI001573E75E|nr:ATP-binding hybrid sensor histidine kinase/response regulator [Marinifaba aquimaris]NTS78728.1 response regulator [Marinifaba aquimaris]
MYNINEYDFKHLVLEQEKHVLYSGSNNDQRHAILKAIKPECLSDEVLQRFKRGLNFLNKLAGNPNVASVEHIEQTEELTGVIFDCEHYTPMVAWLEKAQVGLEQKLKFCCQLVAAVDSLHQNKITHTLINPNNILVNPNTLEIKLIGFEDALEIETKLTKASELSLSIDNLPYISPEQTARTNRKLDYRADYYSIGCVIYRLMTGEQAITAHDTLGFLHAHIAVEPKPAHQINPEIQPEIAAILDKLMAKNAEDRYQSAFGIKADFIACIKALQGMSDINSFAIAKYDVDSQFYVSQKLIGREHQLRELINHYQASKQEQTNLVFIKGASGTGKSALVSELQKTILTQQGAFTHGKCDQYNRGVPYSAFVYAIEHLIQSYLTQTDNQIAQLKTSLLYYLEGNGALMTALFPDLTLIIGEQAPVSALPSHEADARFSRVFIRMIKAFCQIKPLCLFLDDLQWADPASLALIEHLLVEKDFHGLFIIVAYRDNEVSDDHPLSVLSDKLSANNAPCSELHLPNLSISDIAIVLSETLNRSLNEVSELALVCQHKTGGNPFYLNQLLTLLNKEGFIYFQADEGCWAWDIDAIGTWQVSANVVELLTRSFDNLSVSSREVLKIAALVGNLFSLRDVLVLTNFDKSQTADALYELLKFELILPLNDNFSFLNEQDDSLDHISLLSRFKFIHDQVQHAAYQMLPADEAQTLHLKYARILDGRDKSEQFIFSTVEHVNAAVDLLVTPKDKRYFAELNHSAAIKAKAANAYQAAFDFLEVAQQLIIGIEVAEQTRLDILLLQAELHFLCGRPKAAIEVITTLLDSLGDVIYQAKALCLKVTVLTNLGQLQESLAVGCEAIHLLDPSWPDEKGDIDKEISSQVKVIENYLARHSIESLLALPEAKTEHHQLLMNLVAMCWPAALNVNLPMSTLCVLKLVTLSIQNGNSLNSPFGYANYGTMLCAVHQDYRQGYAFGKLAMQLIDKTNNVALKGKVYTMFGVTNSPWSKPLKNNVAILKDALVAGQASGDLIFTSHSAFHVLMLMQMQGVPLTELNAMCAKNKGIIEKVNDSNVVEVFSILNQMTAQLQGHTSSNRVWDHQGLDEQTLLNNIIDNEHSLCLNYYHFNKLFSAIVFGRTAEAIDMAAEMAKTLAFTFGWFSIAEHCFLQALALVRGCREGLLELDDTKSKVINNLRQIISWEKNCPSNFSHKRLLIEAELACLDNRPDTASHYYDMAINEAQEAGFMQYTALSNELASAFWQRQKRTKFARVYLDDAYQAYKSWGASAKLNQLEKEAFWLTKQTESQFQLDLDYQAVMQAAQKLSGTVMLDELLKNLTQSILKLAGAEKAVILLNKENEWFVQAKGAVNPEITAVLQAQPLAAAENLLSHYVVNYVGRTAKQLVLANASIDERFGLDVYIKQKQVKSLLCSPIIKQNKLLGILYLENNLVEQAFTAERLQALDILASQAAISIDNALLYENLESQVTERTQELAKAKLKAEEATLAKSNFLANMSHEIRTPMNAVIGLSRLVMRSKLSPQQQDHVEKIVDSSESLLKLVNDILDFSKIEAQKMTLESVRFDLEKILQRVVNVCAQKVHEKGLELVLDISPDVPKSLIGDPFRLQQVIINLANNAVKFTETGLICIKIELISIEHEETEIKFSIIDTGIGMTQKQQARLFQSFAQADDSVTRKYGGTGLGLAISKQLVELMSGHISVTSEVDKGSTFSFNAIFNYCEDSLDNTPLLDKSSINQLKVMIADDTPIARKVLLNALSSIGVEADSVENGQQALDKVLQAETDKSPYDLIIMDWKMPEMDGIEASKAIVQQVNHQPPHILMVSAYDKDEAKRLAKETGIKQFLEKPLNASILVDTIHDFLYHDGRFNDAQISDNHGSIPDLSQYRILLVEDNEVNKQVALGFLADTHVQVLTACDGVQAVEMVQSEDVDLVLMDIQMPKLDGLSATRMIRKDLEILDLPIIAMTAHAMEGDAEKSKQAGMQAHLTKPIEPEQLFATLAEYLSTDKHINDVDYAKTSSLYFKDLAQSQLNTLQYLHDQAGLDCEQAISKLQGKADLYLELIADFYQKMKVAESDLVNQWNSENWQAVNIFVHSLKSSARYIGDYQLANIAESIEHGFAENNVEQDELKVQFDALLAKLSRLVHELGQITAKPEQTEQQDLDIELTLNTLKEIKQLVALADSDSEDLSKQLVAQTKGTEVADLASKIDNEINDFEFNNAMVHIEQLFDKLSS